MLLHAHPVNEAREVRNQATINSVWLWGGGIKPSPHVAQFGSVWSTDILALALAQITGVPSHPQPDLSVLLKSANVEGNSLAALPQLRTVALRGNFDGWCSELIGLERDWFAPLLEALRQRRLAGVTLIALGAKRCLTCAVGGADLWKFWRPLRPLDHHV
jgi:hypothetical protein